MRLIDADLLQEKLWEIEREDSGAFSMYDLINSIPTVKHDKLTDTNEGRSHLNPRLEK